MLPETQDTRFPRGIGGMLTLLGALLVAFQYVTLPKFGVLPPAASHSSLDTLLNEIRSKVALGVADAGLAGAILVVTSVIFLTHLRTGALSRCVAWCSVTDRRAVCTTGVLSLFAARFYFAPGEVAFAADAGPHIAYAWVASQSIAQGELPIWTNYFGAGSPFCQFYGFLFYYATDLVHLVLGDVDSALKLTMAIGHVGSGIAMHVLLRALGHRRSYAIVGGLAYVMTFWHTQQTLIMGRLPVSLIYGLIPVVFLYAVKSLDEDRPRIDHVVPGAFSLAALIFTHPGYGAWTAVLVGLYGATSLTVLGGPNWRLLAGLSAQIGLGILLSGYLTAGMLLESASTGLSVGISLAHLPDPTLSQLLLWSNYRFFPARGDVGHWYGGYLGISIVLIAAGSALARFRRFHRVQRVLPAAVCLGATLVLVFGYRLPIIRDIPGLQVFNAGRYLLFTVFFLCLLVPSGMTSVYVLTRKHHPYGVAVACLCFLALDLGPTTFQQPYLTSEQPQHTFPATYIRAHQDELETLPPREIPNTRLVRLTDEVGRFARVTWMTLRTGVPSTQAVFDESLLGMWAFGAPLREKFAEVLASDPTLEVSYPTVSGLVYLLNADQFYSDQRTRPDEIAVRQGSIPIHSPIVVANRRTRWEGEQFDRANPMRGDVLDSYLRDMQVDQATLRVDAIPVLYQESRSIPDPPSCEVLEHRVFNQRVEMRVRVDAPCDARLAYAYSPSLTVKVNGQAVPTMETVTRFLAISLDEGEQTIVIEPKLSRLRKGFLFFLLLALVGYTVYLVRRSDWRQA